jgi:2-polyprenyl-3-methyl-5-hydroxy-6-metoxy-1,4-benzoquinol methylase
MGKEASADKDDFFKFEYKRGGGIYQYISENMKRGIVNARIVEIGCGAGGILQYFKEKGNDVYGVDLGSEYIEFGRDNYDLNIATGTIDNVMKKGISPDIVIYSHTLEDNVMKKGISPDIVIYSHTLEHILNPVEELIKLKSISGSNTYLYIELPGVKYLTHSYDTNFLKQLQNAHVYYFTLTTLKNALRKAGWDFVCGNEVIHSIFTPSSSSNREVNYESDYDDAMSFLRRMEFYRFMPTPYNIKRLTMPAIVSFLKRAGLYNIVAKTYNKLNL